MDNIEIAPGLKYIGAADPEYRGFIRGEYVQAGMRYNSYLATTGEGPVLFGSVPESFIDTWLEDISAQCGNAAPCAMVLFGTEYDLTCAQALLERYPHTKLIGDYPAIENVDGLVPDGFGRTYVRTDRKISLGGRELQFKVISGKTQAPSLYVLDSSSGALICADVFGSLCAGGILMSGTQREDYELGCQLYKNSRNYKDAAGNAKKAVSYATEQMPRVICPAFGPVIDSVSAELMGSFESDAAQERRGLALVYEPSGYNALLAKKIAQGAGEAGIEPVELLKTSEIKREELLKRLSGCSAVLFGTGATGGDAGKAIWDITTSLREKDWQGRECAVFGSYASFAPAAENLRARLKMLGMDLSHTDLMVQGKPDGGMLKNAVDFGFDFGCYIRRMPNPRKPKLVKCLVCGEIFDASLGICPVCGVGLDRCVPADEDESLYSRDTDSNYVIIGGGIAALSAAQAIRQRDGTGKILMLSAEKELPINRPMLSKGLEALKSNPGAIGIHDGAWYAEKNISILTGKTVESISPCNKTVSVKDGESYCYDKLIIATGAECFVPPFPGRDKDGVITLRHLDDALKLAHMADKAKNAVVIGGGVIGLEAANELMRAGVKTVVLEATPQIVGRQIDAGSAKIIREKMEKLGVKVYEGVSIASIDGDDKVKSVSLADGRSFDADIVLVSCGNRANIAQAKDAGIATDRAIIVDERMRTNVEDIFACGDCAQLDGVNYQLWQEATEQGKTAGANAAGEKVSARVGILGLSLEGFGTSLFAIGDAGKKDGAKYSCVEINDDVRKVHEKYWFTGAALQGAVIIGNPDKTAQISNAVATHARLSELF